MKTVFKVSLFELENLFCKKTVWILTVGYTLLCFAICLSEDLRHSYFSVMESVPVALNNFVLPVVLMIILTGALTPVFAGDKEQGIEQITAACRTGSKGRSVAKMLSATLFSVFMVILLEMISFVLCFTSGLFDAAIPIRYVATEVKLQPIWTAGEHTVFSMFVLMIGCIILSILILFISCICKNTLSAVSLTCIFLLTEFVIHKFSFPTLLQEYNIWVFFRPYYLFITEIFNVSPYANLLLFTLAFLPLCWPAVCQIVKKGV